ncbi:MAG: ATPase, T2SS/T4P/T4SS family [Oligoflexia bacterium]|nr:ATPase, T2SS/T4P/T4SS family [Oligoflexia bacterium]
MNTPEWLTELLNDPLATDICLNGSETAFVDRGNGQGMTEVPHCHWPADVMRDWLIQEITRVGKAWDARNPFIDATLASGHRLHAAFPPLSRQGLLVSLRRLPEACREQARPESCRARWSSDAQSQTLFLRLEEKARAGDSVLISGATGSGKTTLANDLLTCVAPSERIIALEDTPELAPAHPHFVSLQSRPPNAEGQGEVTLRTLLRQALRMRPDRIVLGECRGPEVLDLLQALNTGHRGLISTLHANSPRDALRRVELLCMMASGGAIPLLAIRELLATGVQWVAQVRHRKIEALWKIEGREGETILMRNDLAS